VLIDLFNVRFQSQTFCFSFIETIFQKNMSEPCLVCGRLTEKLHLQVQICYGCAAFFRRSVNSFRKYKCRNAQNNGFCRLCRYNRCLQLDLKIKKSCQKPSIFEIDYKVDKSNPWNIFDMFYQIHSLFKKGSCHSFPSTSTDFLPNLNKLISSMVEVSLPKQQWMPFSVSEESTLKTAFFINNFAINSAKLLSSFPTFQKLSIEEKLLLHDRFWQMFMLLRDYYVSFEHFGYESEFKCLIDNYQYVDKTTARTSLEVDLNNEGSKTFVIPFETKLTKFYEEFKKVKPTFFEFSYICLIVLWSFHSLPQVSETTQNMSNKILENAATNLHEYYIKELRMSGYAARQAKLYKIAIMVEGIMQSKNEMLKAWSLFNFGKHAFPFPKFEINYYIYKN
jgi:nuclear factor 4